MEGDGHPIRSIIIIILLVVCNAFICAAEEAIGNVNEANARKRAEEGDRRAKRVVRFLDRPERYENVLCSMFMLIGILIGMLYTFSHYWVLRDWVATAWFTEKVTWQPAILMVLVTIVLTYFIVLFGAIIPKKLGRKYAQTCAYTLSGFLCFLNGLFAPIFWLLEKNTNLFLRILHIRPNELSDNVTEEEIMSIVNEGQEQGVLEEDEAEMITNIIEFSDNEVKDIMTHRKKMVAVSDEMSVEEALHFMVKETFSRFPLYHETIDDIIGVLHLKDVTIAFLSPDMKQKPLASIAREPYFIPESQSIDVLFEDMQAKKIHMAIAIDEYGQTAGLVAMEDILEEIVGDIQDEYDDEEEELVRQEDGTYIVLGDCAPEELKDEIGVPFDEDIIEDYDTVNGFLISQIGHIPADDECAIIEYAGYRFEPVIVKGKMIHSVRVTVPVPKDDAEADTVLDEDVDTVDGGD